MKRTIFLLQQSIIVLGIAWMYGIFVLFLINSALVFDTIIGPFSRTYKTDLLLSIPGATWIMMETLERIPLLLTALLTAMNLVFGFHAIRKLGKIKNLHVAAGGSSILAIAGNGCSSCGLSIISLLGLSGVLAVLPFRGIEISYLAVFLLCISLYFMIKSQKSIQACAIMARKKVINNEN